MICDLEATRRARSLFGQAGRNQHLREPMKKRWEDSEGRDRMIDRPL